jgi:hypothetical protein
LEYDWFIRTDVGAVLLDQVAGNRFRKRSGFLRYAAHDGAVSSFGRNDGSVGEGKLRKTGAAAMAKAGATQSFDLAQDDTFLAMGNGSATWWLQQIPPLRSE